VRLVRAERFGQRAHEPRAEEGVSLRRVAARAQIAPTHLSHIESGDAIPTLGVAERVAAAVDSTVGSLLGEYEEIR
jgi:transcriptional regulator with XRE-family HTH domain